MERAEIFEIMSMNYVFLSLLATSVCNGDRREDDVAFRRRYAGGGGGGVVIAIRVIERSPFTVALHDSKIATTIAIIIRF